LGRDIYGTIYVLCVVFSLRRSHFGWIFGFSVAVDSGDE